MENASKALIIAGAILLAILIIGLGMVIYSRASGALDTSTIDQQKVQAYNSPYEQYFGTGISGSQVRALCDTVRSHNNATSSDDTLKITMNMNSKAYSSSTELNTLKSLIKSGQTYTVQAGTKDDADDGYSSSTGYLTQIFIK